MIYFTADWHFNHDREFVYKPRGFDCVEDMNEAIVERHNKIVEVIDTVYILGDLCLGGGDREILNKNKTLIESLRGNLKIILGNHDTPNRIQMYSECKNVTVLGYADLIKYRKYHFYISHFPTITSNLSDSASLKQRTLNLYGHTHQRSNFFDDNPTMYHVGVDSHGCKPIDICIILAEMHDKIKECINQL